MYKYKIGYSSHEESEYWDLEHEKLFTQDEITQMIGEVAIEIIKNRKEHDYLHSFQEFLMCGLMKNFIEKYGFKEITYDMSWDIFGWPSIFSKEDWKSQRDETLDKLTDIINKAGYDRKDDDFLKERG